MEANQLSQAMQGLQGEFNGSSDGAAPEGGKNFFSGRRWKRANKEEGGEKKEGANRSVFGGRWKKASAAAKSSPRKRKLECV